MSEIEAKLRKFYMPDITSICEQCNWELDACEEPELKDYSKEAGCLVQAWYRQVGLYFPNLKLCADPRFIKVQHIVCQRGNAESVLLCPCREDTWSREAFYRYCPSRRARPDCQQPRDPCP